MARTGWSTGNYLITTAVPSLPITMAAQALKVETGSNYDVMAVGTDGSNYFLLQLRDLELRLRAEEAGAAHNADISGNTGPSTWVHVAGVIESATSRTPYLNGIAGATGTDSRNPALAETTVGTGSGQERGFANTGHLAEAAIWSVGLSAAEIAALAAGVPPRLIRPESLWGYWPIWGVDSPEPDLSGNQRSLTVTGTLTRSNHAPIVIRMPPSVIEAAAVQTETQRLAPDAVLAASNLQDTLANSPPTRLADIDEDVDADDTEWWTAIDATLATDARVGFPTPSAALSGTQTFKARLRKTAGTPDPTIDMILQGTGVTGSPVTLLSGVAITATDPGQVVSGTIDASQITDPAEVELRIVSTPGTA